MRIGLLGPLEVAGAGGTLLAIGGPKERTLLAVLAVHANEAVSESRLVDVLWGDEPPRTATRTLQAYLSRLRKILGEVADDDSVSLDSVPAGWTLRLAPGVLDLDRVQEQVAAARTAAGGGDHVGAALCFADALGAWRGQPLEEFADQPWAALEARRLEELRELIAEERVDAELACGRHAELIAELEATCAAHPFRERPRGQLMVALYRAGRQAEALQVYQGLRTTLAEELGIDPSPATARLEAAILSHDPELATPPRPRSLEPGAMSEASLPRAHDEAGGRGLPRSEVTTGGTGVLTVLFTDIVASTELLTAIGDEAYDRFWRDHLGVVRGAVAAERGNEVKSLGDGVMAVFSSAVDAVRCAIDIQSRVARQKQGHGEPGVGVRIGVHAGEPVRSDDDFFGASVVIAKRLCDAAGGGQIVISRLVADLVASRGEFELTDLGPQALHGIAEPVGAHLVAWGERGPFPPPSTLAMLRVDGFVGRERELEQLTEAYRRATVGERQVLLMAGEPGIGKTSLAVHMADRAAAEGAVVLFGRCDEASIVTFQPFVEALAHYVEHVAPEVLRTHLGPQAEDLALLLPELSRKLPEYAGLANTGAETERYRIFAAVPALLTAIGRGEPVVLILDDLHWADRPTLQLFLNLIRRTADARLLIVGTYRDTDLVRTHPMAETLGELRRSNLVSRMVVRGLGGDDVVDLLTAGGEPDSADRSLAAALWAETEGSPLFIREILRHLSETGVVAADETGRLRAQRRIDQLGIPEGVREVIGRRLSRLSGAANEALLAGSVMGRQVRLDVLEEVTALDSETLLDAMEEATRAGVLTEPVGVVGRYDFTHALVRQALYEELSLTRRVRMHQRVGEALERLEPGEGPHLAELAHHFTQAALASGHGKAIEYGRRAGERAVGLAAYEEAARHFTGALEVAEDGGADVSVRADLLLGAGNALALAADIPAARSVFERVAAMVGPDDPERLARAALGHCGARVRALWIEVGRVNGAGVEMLEQALATLDDADSILRASVMACLARELYWVAGTAERREQLRADALAMGRRLGDPAALAFLLCTTILGIYRPGNAVERGEDASEACAMASAAGDRQLELFARLHRMVADMELHGEASSDDAATVEILAQELKDPQGLMMALFYRGGQLVVRGRVKDAEPLIEEAFRIGREANDPNTFSTVAGHLGTARLLERRTDEVLGAVRDLEAVFPGLEGLLTGVVGGACADAGRPDEARMLLDGYDLDALPRDALFLYACLGFGIAYFWLDEPEAAARLHATVAPYEQLHANIGFYTAGPVKLTMWFAASAARDTAEADRLAAELRSTLTQRGHCLPLAMFSLFAARDLLGRGTPDERAQAAELVGDAEHLAEEHGLEGVAREAAELRELLALGAGADAARQRQATRPRNMDRARSAVARRGRSLVARWTRDATDDELVARFSSRLAQRALFGAMARAFQPSEACGFEGAISIELRPPLEDPDPAASDWWTIDIEGRRATARPGRADSPSAVVRVGLAEFIRIVSGERRPSHAVTAGSIDLEGDFLLVGRIPDMFAGVEPVTGTV